MTPFYLRFSDAKEAIAKLAEAALSDGISLDLIGESYRNDAVFDGMKLVKPATKRSGYFVNWIGDELPATLTPFATEPATPFRVFAGFSPEEIAAREAAKNPPELLP